MCKCYVNFVRLFFIDIFFVLFFPFGLLAQQRTSPFFLEHELTQSSCDVIGVQGIMICQGKKSVLLSKGSKTRVVCVGQTVWGWRVENIKNDCVTIKKGETLLTINIK